MPSLQPIYTPESCRVAYQLNWAVTLFGRELLPDLALPVEQTKPLLEGDGVRILEHRAPSARVSEFLVSTQPMISPARLLQVLKGRLQHALRKRLPKAFRRNYRLESVGSAKRDVIESYVARQIERHPMADPHVQERLAAFQIKQPDVDLSRLRYSAHGQYTCNLHVVVEHADNWSAVDETFLNRTEQMIRRVCKTKGLLLSKAGIVADHLHLAVGFQIEQTPQDIAIGLLNNLAYAHGMKPLYKHGYYVGTFGNFDLGALRNVRRQG